jgi:eukaryotic-like serine/threonine-protein kinase
MSDVPIGALIDGRYRVVSRLGSGGMADVFLAQDQQLGRNVALKLLHRRFAEDPGFVERFRREAQAAAGLQHPNVVGVYDRGDFDDTYYIAMEHLSGRSLKQLIRQEAPLDAIRAIDITLQILKAARFAHRHGVIHRDLKPHNVIVDETGHVKVTDFGIARAGASDMTETGSIMGTAQYLSPEQAQGHAVGETSDLYSVGVILYELLTGQVPFDAESAVTIALKHVSEAPSAPTRLNPAVPPALEEVVMWTLNKNPADRPRNADELIRALEAARAAILAGEAGERTAAMAAVGAPGAVVGGFGVVDPPVAGAPATPPPPVVPLVPPVEGDGAPPLLAPGLEEPPGERRRRWRWVALVLVLLLLLGGGAFAAWYFLIRTPSVTVPPVVGQQVSVARTILENGGFKVSVTPEPSPSRVGQVIGEIPNGGSNVKQGSTIQLAVSSGPGLTTVPTLSGDSLAQARRELRQKGLKVGRIQLQNSSQFPPGRVISTSPAAGATPQVGTAVDVFVSSGVKVPDVTGETESQAKSNLEAAGFTVITNTQTSSSATPGTVIDEVPAGGTPLAAGSNVTIVVAKAPPRTATVPTVIGEKAGVASSQIQAAGLSVVEQQKSVGSRHRDGLVLRQSPSGGSTVRKGSTVTIIVGQYTPPTGPTGTTGPTGPTGPTGTTGPTGPHP